MSDNHVDAETLTENVELSTECVAIAIGSAMALDASNDPVRVLQQSIAIWPDAVSDHALVIGQRVALALAYQLDLDRDAVAQIAVALMPNTTDNGGTDNNGEQ